MNYSHILSMLNFMQPYIQGLLHHTVPFRELLKKNQVVYWDEKTNAAFHKLKSFISKAHSTPLLYYKRYLPITAQA